ncbi:TIGR03089 family protein [Ornithinimicrobium cerasi]|uniref:TIGR03089 family protein n=1 Tax=Ornithinimicrobium cerasi TaxID=2248773 RepID=A0A285VIW8_9MICO|nr:TIGR03089 family protein [Ornithinimicrobium cerasi]SOC52491.1 TIGR03089 family protein [Ornithinimicrobium cerasi]
MRFPSQVLADAVTTDATRPALTFYDDTPDARGERIEISRRVLRTWVSKAANALQEGLDVQPGSVVLVDLPSPHWRLAYWALAVWSVGATLTLDVHEGADVLVTTEPDSELAEDCDEVVAVALPALSRDFGTELRSGVMDEAAELSSYADDFTPWDEVDPDDVALVHGGERLSYGELLDGLPPVPAAGRALLTTTDRGLLVRQVLQVLAADGSAVLVRGPVPPADDSRMAAEGVTHRCSRLLGDTA